MSSRPHRQTAGSRSRPHQAAGNDQCGNSGPAVVAGDQSRGRTGWRQKTALPDTTLNSELRHTPIYRRCNVVSPPSIYMLQLLAVLQFVFYRFVLSRFLKMGHQRQCEVLSIRLRGSCEFNLARYIFPIKFSVRIRLAAAFF